MRVEQLSEDVTIYNADCREVLPTLGKVDAVVTDPPYSAATHAGARGKGATTGGKHILVNFEAFTPEVWRDTVAGLCGVSRRWVVVFCDWRVAQYAAALPLIRMGVWVKNDPAPQFTGDRPATGWEQIAIFHNDGRKRWNGGGRPAVWRTNIEKRGEHSTQKPLELMLLLVSDFTDTAEVVLDPYMGSGTTGVACVRLGRKFIGIEIDPGYFDIALRRISDELKRPRLPLEDRPPAPVQEGLSL